MTRQTIYFRTDHYSVDDAIMERKYAPMLVDTEKRGEIACAYGKAILLRLNLIGGRTLVLWYDRDEQNLYRFKL